MEKSQIKFMWNGIKVNGKLFRARYFDGALTNYPKGTITIYAKDRVLPQVDGLTIQNDSDVMTDYFEEDRIRVTPDNPHYQAVVVALRKKEEHYMSIHGRRA